ncbi:uncharacterized protein LOC118349595 [Juglans regia]|uniref:Uncharacterized protein LOC118349595 n=2 Tax=Juglans regia TaxID=51240 RepID=A0A6P9ET10_JUGRE|nr:uncharacterized protein LOC118349595 [Juglans regia]
MADIAILVAEEYERRVRDAGKVAGGGEAGFGVDLVSSASALAQRLQVKIGSEKIELVKYWVREPRSQISMAATTGFFSA